MTQQRKRHCKSWLQGTIVSRMANGLFDLCDSILHVLARVAGDVLRREKEDRIPEQVMFKVQLSRGDTPSLPQCPTKMLRVDFQLIKVVQNSHILLVECPEPG